MLFGYIVSTTAQLLDAYPSSCHFGALQWGEEGVDVKDKHYRLVRLHFMDKSPPQTDSPSPNAEGMGDTAFALLNGAL